MKNQKYLVIHCTATAEGKEITSAQIRLWHTSPKPHGRGWKQVGYTDMIHLDGQVENLVPNDYDNVVEPWEITNGVAGMNSVCLHVVYVGGLNVVLMKPQDTRTPEQKKALETYVKKIIRNNPDVQVAGHYQFDPGKACPSFNVPEWLKSIGIEEKNIYRKP